MNTQNKFEMYYKEAIEAGRKKSIKEKKKTYHEIHRVKSEELPEQFHKMY